LGIAPFQLLVSNLYPFEAAVSSGAPPPECVEQIDIGGPAMVRAAAKNHEHVAVITDPSRVAGTVDERLVCGGGLCSPWNKRRRLAARAYAHTAAVRLRGGLLVRLRLCARRDRAGDRLAGRDRGVVDPGERPSGTGRTRTAGRAVRPRL